MLSLLLPRFCSSAILVLGWVTALSAQPSRPLQAPPEFAIDQWTTEHGLPQNSVNAIAQSSDGYLWIGTFGGLARFDGDRFTLMLRSDRGGRQVDRVLALASAPDGALWIGTENGLLRRGTDGAYRVFTTEDGLPHDEVHVVHADSAGFIWLGTGANALTWHAAGSLGSVTEVAGVPVGRVLSIVGGADGRIWINLETGRVLSVSAGDTAAMQWWDAPIGGSVRMLLEDRAGARWLGVSDGTARVVAGAVRRHPAPGPPHLLTEDHEGGFWGGTINDGLFHFTTDADSMRVQRYALPDGRQGFRVRAAHHDADGSVWIGTNANGLLRARRNLFTTYVSEHGLSHDVTTAVFGDARGTMWVATNCGGVNAIDSARQTVRVFNPRSPNDAEGDPCIFALAQGPGGTMFQGSYGGGVSTLPRPPGSPHRSVAELPDDVVLALLTGRDGTLWVGMRGGGLAAIENGRVRATYSTAEGLAHNSVRFIHEARDGTLWIGTLEGLSRLEGSRLTSYTAADGLSSGHVRAIHEDHEGTLWIGTYGGGLNRFRDGVFTPITLADGLGDDVVSAILEDDSGHLWMSGNRGIYRVAKSQLIAFAEGRLPRVHSVLYGRADGLLNPETNGGFQPAAWKDLRGHLWFPTVLGVAVVDPARALRAARAPSVTLEEVLVDGAPVPPDELVGLGPGRPNLEFRYSGLSLSAPEHLTFRYRLEGFDADWVEAGARRVAYYPHLPAGSYRFRVHAANRDGRWGESSEILQLRVAPPFWRSWGGRLLAAAMLATLAIGVVRQREAGARRERAAKDAFARRLIDSQEQERSRLAGELHDGLGQELLIVKNRALLALRSTGMNAGVRAQLDQISEVATSSIRGIRDLAHNLTPHQLDHLGLTSALEAMTDAMAETSGIDMQATIESVDGLLPVASQINLYRIVQEGLSNISRHAEARTATLHIRRVDGVIRVTMADRGRGFDRQRNGDGNGTSGLGLYSMAERARILGGTLEVRSAPGHGTRIELSVPAEGDVER